MSLQDLDLPAVMRPAWEAIQAQHPGLPDVSFKLTTEYAGRKHQYRARVDAYGGRSRADDLTIEFSPSGLLRPWVLMPEDRRTAAENALGTLLHEAAHVRDLMRWGRATGHGLRFAGFAAELGLDVWLYVPAYGGPLRMSQYGTPEEASSRRWWSNRKPTYRTEWNPGLAAVYAATLADLGTAIAPWAPLLSEWHRNQPGGGL